MKTPLESQDDKSKSKDKHKNSSKDFDSLGKSSTAAVASSPAAVNKLARAQSIASYTIVKAAIEKGAEYPYEVLAASDITVAYFTIDIFERFAPDIYFMLHLASIVYAFYTSHSFVLLMTFSDSSDM